MSNRVGILLSAINGFNEDMLQLGIGPSISRMYSPLLFTIEASSILWHIVQIPLETIAKFFLCPLKCCPRSIGKAIKKWDKALDPLDTVAKVIKLILGLISSLFLAWSMPTWNVRLHWTIDKLPGSRIFGEETSKFEKEKVRLAVNEAVQTLQDRIAALEAVNATVQPLQNRIAALEQTIKDSEQTNKDLNERYKSVHDTNSDQAKTIEHLGAALEAAQKQLTEAKLASSAMTGGSTPQDPIAAMAQRGDRSDDLMRAFVAEAAANRETDPPPSPSSTSSSFSSQPAGST